MTLILPLKGDVGKRRIPHRVLLLAFAFKLWSMPEPVTLAVLAPLFLKACGQVAGPLLRKAAEKHVESFFGEQLQKLAGLGKKDDVVDAAQKAYALWFEWMLRNVQTTLGFEGEELADEKELADEYAEAAERLLDDETVFHELLKPVRDSDDKPDLDVLRDAWRRHGCPPLPLDEGFSWTAALTAYLRQVEKQKIGHDSLRDQLVAEMLAESLRVQKELLGVRTRVDERRYAARMREKYRVLDLTALQSPTVDDPGELHLRKVFLPQDVREDPPPVELPKDLLRRLVEEGEWTPASELPEDHRDEALARRLEQARESFRSRPRQPVLEAVGGPGERRMVILGGAGSGKSTLLRYLLLSLLDPPTDPETGEPPAWMEPLRGHFPLLIELREYIAQQDEGGYTTFLDFLDHLGSNDGYGLTGTHVDQRLRNDPSLVLFDGLDEIFDPAERERLAQRIAAFAGDYPGARVLVTSRSVGYPERPLRNAGFRHFGLEDLDDDQITTFVQGWFRQVFPRKKNEREQRFERVLEATKRSQPIRLLAGNPMLLTIMTLIAQFRELPRERWRFYDYAAEVLCHHWDANRHLEDEGLGELLYLRAEDKKELLRRLAWRMQVAEKGLAGNFIHRDELAKEVGAFVQERLEAGVARGKVAEITDTLIARLRDRNYVLCLRGPKLYGFVHRTLLEYFCAAELARRLEKEPDFSIEDLRGEFRDRWEDEAWAEPLRLVCGMVGEKYAAELIEELLAANPDWVQRKELLPRHLVLAVQCLGEVAKLGEIGTCARKVLEEILDGFHGLASSAGNPPFVWRAVRLLEEELLPAASEIGTRWPGREILLKKLRGPAFWGRLDRAVPRLVANLLAEQEEVLETLLKFAKSSDPDTAVGALVALAESWPHQEDVFELVQQRATQDDDEGVRRTAVETLAGTWPEREGVFDLIRDRATQDDHWVVRDTAVETLARTWPERDGVFDLIQQRATRDDHPFVRSTALGQVLALGLRARSVQVAYSRHPGAGWPRLDPLEPIPPEHVSTAAAELKMAEAELREVLAAEEEFLGWNPLEGARAKLAKQEGEG